MSLVTTCPSCGTMFRIQPVALTAHGGEGRCSVCHFVFNALEYVSHISEDANTASFEAITDTAAEEDAVDAMTEPVALDEVVTESETIQRETPVVELPETLFQKKRFSWPTFLKPLSAALGLLLLALLQVSLFFREPLISHVPAAYPALSGLCRVLACTVPLPHQAGKIAIEDYRLRSHPDYNEVLVLESTLHNRASFSLAFPVLNLTLTDDFNAPVASRLFKPEDYLPKDTDFSQGIGGKSSVSIQLHLGVAGIKSSKYKLFAQDALPAAPPSAGAAS